MCKVILQGKVKGKDAFFPVPAELTQDILYVVFIDQQAAFEERAERIPLTDLLQDLLLVIFRYLGIRDDKRRKEGVGIPAFGTTEAFYTQTEGL